MAIQCVTNWASSNTRSAGRIGSFTGTAANQTQAAHTMAVRIRHTSSATNYDSVVFRFANSADQGGSYVGRQASGAATQLTFYRSNGAFSTFDQVQTTGGYGSTTATVHLALVYDGSTIRPYINGVAGSTVASTNTRVPTSSAGAHAVQIAGQHPGVYSDALFVKRALSATEIVTLANIRRPDQSILADAIGWYPEWFDDAYTDLSPNVNTASNLGTTGTVPAAVNESVPVQWEGQKYWAFFAAPGPTLLVSSGSSPTTGAVTLTAALPLTAAGNSPTTGAATLTAALPLVGSGTSPTTGAVTLSVAMPIAGSAVSPTTGTVALSIAMPLAAAATSPTSGAAALDIALPLAATATSPTLGSATLGVALPVAASGVSPTSGNVTLQVDFPIAASGVSPTSGAATLSTSGSNVDLPSSGVSPTSGAAALNVALPLTASGTSPSSGAAALNVALPVAASGVSPTSGAAALALANSLSTSGVSPTSGTAAISLANQLAASGVSPTSGTATLTLVFSLQATGASSTSGSAVLNGANPPASWPNDPAPSRRYIAGYGRRPIR